MANPTPKLLFCLFKYFPFGGLQRRFMQIALAAQALGYDIDVLTFEWQGDKPEHFNIRCIPIKSRFNHKRPKQFCDAVRAAKASGEYALVIGFNKIPGVDLYYAADPCYAQRLKSDYPWWYAYTPRGRAFLSYERDVFAPEHNTHVLLISENEKPHFMTHHGTRADQFFLLPPGISKDRIAPEPAMAKTRRNTKRAALNLTDDQTLLLMVGSGFETKGLDRAIRALAALPEALRTQTHLFVCGQGHEKPFLNLAKQLGVVDKLHLLGGRNDIPDLLLAADLLLQPSVIENTGSAIIEAIASGTPVLANSVCGYAKYVVEAQAGELIPAPYVQTKFNQLLRRMLEEDLSKKRANALAYTQQHDFTALPKIAAAHIHALAQA